MSRAGLILIVMLAQCGELKAHPGSGVVVDRRKHVFFTDTGKGIWEAAPDGALRLVSASALHWLAAGTRDMRLPSGGEFELLRPEGSDLVLVLSSDFPCAVAPDGSVVYADTRPPTRIVRRRANGREDVVAQDPAPADPARPSLFHAITGIAIGVDGTILVMDVDRDSNAHAIHEIDARGRVTTRASNFIPLDTEPRRAEKGDLCRGLACSGSGVVYVAAPGARCVVSIDRHGPPRIVLRAPAPWSPTAVATDGGHVYVLEYTDTPAGADGSDRSVWVPRVRRVSSD